MRRQKMSQDHKKEKEREKDSKGKANTRGVKEEDQKRDALTVAETTMLESVHKVKKEASQKGKTMDTQFKGSGQDGTPGLGRLSGRT